MAAATRSNRFAPLSSPEVAPASRSNSPSRSDTSQSRSNPSTSYRSIASRLDTYPPTWTYAELFPQQLATCGFSYSTKFGEETCLCHACDIKLNIQKMARLGEWSNDDLLSSHDEDCLLADLKFDMINNVSNIYTPTGYNCRLHRHHPSRIDPRNTHH